MRLSESGLFVQEIDGSPKGFCSTLKVTNGVLTDNMDGTFTLTIASGHGALTGLLDDDHTIYHTDARGDLRYAALSKGVTNGDLHDHSGGDGAQIAYANLSGLPTIPTQENIEDYIGGMVSGNTETGISVTYDDENGKLNFDASHNHDLSYAPIAKGVTNGDSHDHSGGDGAQVDHGGLAGLSDDDHTIYLKLAARGSAQTIEDPVIFSNNVTMGLLNFGTNPGAMAAFDMTVTAAAGVGTEESYDLNIDGTEFIKCYAESDGAGSLQNKSIDLSQLLRLKQSGAMYLFQRDEAVADDGYIDLPDATAGFVFVSFNESVEYGAAVFTDAGAVTLLHNSANCVNTDTDTKYCIFDNGTSVRVRNRSGGAINVKIFGFMG